MYLSQHYHDRKSLALHRLVTEKLRKNPDLLQQAKSILLRWIPNATAGTVHYYLNVWLAVIEEGVDSSIELMTEESERATALRQSSPFSCCLTPKERIEFLEDFKSKEMSKTNL